MKSKKIFSTALLATLAYAAAALAADDPRDSFSPDTPRLKLPPANPRAAVRIAIVGDMSPSNAASPRYLAETITELNLLRPDAILSVGNLIDGLTRNPKTYLDQIRTLRNSLDQ